jgi:DNA-binding protein YbaB
MFDNHFVLLANVRNGEKIQIAPTAWQEDTDTLEDILRALNHARQKKKTLVLFKRTIKNIKKCKQSFHIKTFLS